MQGAVPVAGFRIPWGSLLTSFVLHVAVLVGIQLGTSAPDEYYVPAASVTIRLVSGEGELLTPASGATKLERRATASVALSAQTPNRSDRQPTQPAGRASQAQDDAAPTRTGQSDYLPKAALSVGPEPLSPIEVLPPDDVTGNLTVVVVLAVFIDENGLVQNVEVESPQDMEKFSQAAKQAFEKAVFKPGLLAGKPVKSVIKVAVEFEQRE